MQLKKYGRFDGGELVRYPDVTVKSVNKKLKVSGYIIKFAGYDTEWSWPVYRFDRLPNTKHAVSDPFVRVYALGDYSEEDWLRTLIKRLRKTSPQAANRATEKRAKAKKKLKGG